MGGNTFEARTSSGVCPGRSVGRKDAAERRGAVHRQGRSAVASGRRKAVHAPRYGSRETRRERAHHSREGCHRTAMQARRQGRVLPRVHRRIGNGRKRRDAGPERGRGHHRGPDREHSGRARRHDRARDGVQPLRGDVQRLPSRRARRGRREEGIRDRAPRGGDPSRVVHRRQVPRCGDRPDGCVRNGGQR